MTNSRPPSETIEIKIPASYENLEIIGACVESMLQAAGETEDRLQLGYKIHLAVHEVCTNIIEHAYAGLAGQIRLAFSIAEVPISVVVDLWDDGASFDPSAVVLPDLNRAQANGYGLYLVQQLMDEMRYESLPGQNHWRLVKRLSPSHGV